MLRAATFVLAAVPLGCSLLVPLDDYDRGGGSALHLSDASADALRDAAGEADRRDVERVDAGATPDAAADVVVRDAAVEAPRDALSPLTYREVVLSDAPAAYFRLGEMAGTSAPVSEVALALDDASYGVGTTLGVPGAIKGDPNTAVRFDGVRGQVNVGLVTGFDFSGMASYSFEIWCQAEVTGGTPISQYFELWGKDNRSASSRDVIDAYLVNNPTADAGLFISLWADRIVNDVYNQSTVAAPEPGLAAQSPPWTYVVVTYGPSGAASFLTLYVNGAQADQVQSLSTLMTGLSEMPMLLGGHAATDGGLLSNFFKGSLDEFAVYTHVLTIDRVEAHYQAGLGN